ncbi:MAG: zinc ribbon domain-containing protein, partial [bacterium]|nr:zinc ribbon domain-containing protein [bacterium]
MALINCPECKKKISDMAFYCPHCGKPMETTNKAEFIDCPHCHKKIFAAYYVCPYCEKPIKKGAVEVIPTLGFFYILFLLCLSLTIGEYYYVFMFVFIELIISCVLTSVIKKIRFVTNNPLKFTRRHYIATVLSFTIIIFSIIIVAVLTVNLIVTMINNKDFFPNEVLLDNFGIIPLGVFIFFCIIIPGISLYFFVKLKEMLEPFIDNRLPLVISILGCILIFQCV